MKSGNRVLIQFVLFFVFVITPYQGANAKSFIVNIFSDSVDADKTDGECRDAAGKCSLRAAVEQANALPGSDFISLPEGTVVLSLGGQGDDTAAIGELDLLEDVEVNCIASWNPNPEPTCFIDGGGIDRIFDIHEGVAAEFTQITLKNGRSREGGAVRNFGSLTLVRMKITENQDEGGVSNCAIGGGAIFNQDGTLAVRDSRILENRLNNTCGRGGGIRNLRGTVSVEESEVSGNKVVSPDNSCQPSGGGGIASLGGSLEIVDSTISGNFALRGGGVFLEHASGIRAMVRITRSRIEGNSAKSAEGGLFATNPDLIIRNSAIVGNIASWSGGGMYLEKIKNPPPGSIDIRRSEVSANTVADTGCPIREAPFAGNGGGIMSQLPLTLNNSTVRGNRAPASGGGLRLAQGSKESHIRFSTLAENVAANGAGMAFSCTLVDVFNATISNNAATSRGGALFVFDKENGCRKGVTARFRHATVYENTAPREGGGLFVEGTRHLVTLQYSIATRNSPRDCVGKITSEGRNLDGDNSCSFVASTDIPGSALELQPLADNGGHAPTHMPKSCNSPVVDRIPPNFGAQNDQRERPRPYDCGKNRKDIGAVERQSDD